MPPHRSPSVDERRRARRAQIRHAARKGESVASLSKRFEYTPRTVQKIIKNNPYDDNLCEDADFLDMDLSEDQEPEPSPPPRKARREVRFSPTPSPSVQSIGGSSDDGSSTSPGPPTSQRAGPSNARRGSAEAPDPILVFIRPLDLGKKHADALRAHGIQKKAHLDDLRELDLGTLQDVLGKVLVDSKQFTLLEWMKLRSAILKCNDEE